MVILGLNFCKNIWYDQNDSGYGQYCAFLINSINGKPTNIACYHLYRLVSNGRDLFDSENNLHVCVNVSQRFLLL